MPCFFRGLNPLRLHLSAGRCRLSGPPCHRCPVTHARPAPTLALPRGRGGDSDYRGDALLRPAHRDGRLLLAGAAVRHGSAAVAAPAVDGPRPGLRWRASGRTRTCGRPRSRPRAAGPRRARRRRARRSGPRPAGRSGRCPSTRRCRRGAGRRRSRRRRCRRDCRRRRTDWMTSSSASIVRLGDRRRVGDVLERGLAGVEAAHAAGHGRAAHEALVAVVVQGRRLAEALRRASAARRLAHRTRSARRGRWRACSRRACSRRTPAARPGRHRTRRRR